VNTIDLHIRFLTCSVYRLRLRIAIPRWLIESHQKFKRSNPCLTAVRKSPN